MNQPRMNESVNCSGQHRRGEVRTEVNCNGGYVRGVTWSASKRRVNRGVFWARTAREKRTNGPSLRKERGTNVVYWSPFSTSVPPSLSSTHSLLLLCNTSLYRLISEHMSRWCTLKLTLKLTPNVKKMYPYIRPTVFAFWSVLDLLSEKKTGRGKKVERESQWKICC